MHFDNNIEGGVRHFRQPYVRPTGFLNKAPKLFCSVACQTNKGGHHGSLTSLWSMVFNDINGFNDFFT